jgi:hypothetical protein
VTEQLPDWIDLNDELVTPLNPGDDLYRAIDSFEALPFTPGEQAAAWLRARLVERHVPIETHVAMSRTGGGLLGFYSLRPTSFSLGRNRPLLEVRMLSVRRRVKEDAQPGALLEWIARSRGSPGGTGEQIFDHAFANAVESGSVAVLILAHDEPTAKMWRDGYRFMDFDTDPGARSAGVTRLWLPVHPPVQGSWPS